jgi:hypothetical protein
MRGLRTIGVAAVAALTVAAGPLLAGASGSSGAHRAAPALGVDDDVHLNEIQTIGSHNSYHLVPSKKEVELRHTFLHDADQGMMYQHDPLPTQFQSEKVRQIELDVFLDPDGGMYYKPLLRDAAGVGPYDDDMKKPGIKVLHVQDVDYASSCLSLIACLEQVKGWSDANPSHVPIAILLELKDDELEFGDFEFTKPKPWTAAAMDTLDAEIRSVFSEDDMITPDDIRGSHTTLEEAVLADGWPTLGESRGQVLFLMDNEGGYRTKYLTGHPTLEDRVLFTNGNPGQPDAAFVKRNDPADASIPGLVTDGYLVRTRSDGDTAEARSGDTTHREQALASGAQWVSTDYPVPGMAYGFESDYFAEIPGGFVARCNPVNAPQTCDSAVLDTIYTPLERPQPRPTTTTTTTVPGTDVDPADGARPVNGQAAYTG